MRLADGDYFRARIVGPGCRCIPSGRLGGWFLRSGEQCHRSHLSQSAKPTVQDVSLSFEEREEIALLRAQASKRHTSYWLPPAGASTVDDGRSQRKCGATRRTRSGVGPATTEQRRRSDAVLIDPPRTGVEARPILATPWRRLTIAMCRIGLAVVGLSAPPWRR